MAGERIRVNALFSSFAELDKSIKEFGRQNYTCFWKKESKTLESKIIKGLERAAPELKYYMLQYSCILGGRIHVKQIKDGSRRTKTFKQGCPVSVSVLLTPDKKFLQIKRMNMEHNHAVSEEMFLSLPQQRKLSPEYVEKVQKYMKLKEDQKLLREEIRKETGFAVTLKEIKKPTNPPKILVETETTTAVSGILPVKGTPVFQDISNQDVEFQDVSNDQADNTSNIQAQTTNTAFNDQDQSSNTVSDSLKTKSVEDSSVINELKKLNDSLMKPVVLEKEDECDVIAKHIAVQLRELSLTDRIDAKNDIQQILTKLRKNAICAKNVPSTSSEVPTQMHVYYATELPDGVSTCEEVLSSDTSQSQVYILQPCTS